MSVSDKQMFMEKVSASLADKFTATQVDIALQAMTEAASFFEISYIGQEDRPVSEDLMESFLAAIEIEGKSKKTIEHYRYQITKMLKRITVPIHSINVYHIREYLADEKARGLADTTVNDIRSDLGSFFGWLHKEQLIKVNPMANIAPIRCEKKVRTPYSDIDLEKLKEYCETDRNRAILFFLLSTGCRISEVCELNRSDIDFQGMECTVHGKGNKQRTVYFSEVAGLMLKRYIDARSDEHPALFVGKGSDRLTPGGIRFMLRKVASKAGVDNVHPHRFRRTLATNLIKHGMPIQDVARILGHDKLDTTMRYVYMSKETVKNSYRKYA